MKSALYGILLAIIMTASGCSSSKNLTADSVIKNSVWVNLTPAEMNDENGVIINSIYFTEGDRFIMKTGVGQNSSIVAAPVFSEYGTYSYSGSLKKGIVVTLNTEAATLGKNDKMEGVIVPDGMMLIAPDGTESIYFKLQTEKNNPTK